MKTKTYTFLCMIGFSFSFVMAFGQTNQSKPGIATYQDTKTADSPVVPSIKSISTTPKVIRNGIHHENDADLRNCMATYNST